MIQHPDKSFIDPIPMKIHNQPAYCAHVEEEADRKPWFHNIKEYLVKGEYPELEILLRNALFEDCPTISFTAEESYIGGLPIWDYYDVSTQRKHPGY